MAAAVLAVARAIILILAKEEMVDFTAVAAVVVTAAEAEAVLWFTEMEYL